MSEGIYANEGTHVIKRVNFTTDTAADLQAAHATNSFLLTGFLAVNGHATVGTKVQILSGSTVLQEGYCPPLGGQFGRLFGTPVEIPKATALRGKCVTTGADVDINIDGYYANG